jgi:hypothetical protein
MAWNKNNSRWRLLCITECHRGTTVKVTLDLV